MDARLYAYLSYPDAPAALEWFQALGFSVVRRQDHPDGGVVHAEVRLGEAVVMVASSDAPYQPPSLKGRSTGQGLYLLVEDVDALHRAAIDAGATSVIDPEDTEWGSRRSRFLDPQGLEWSAGPYEPGTEW